MQCTLCFFVILSQTWSEELEATFWPVTDASGRFGDRLLTISCMGLRFVNPVACCVLTGFCDPVMAQFSPVLTETL